MRRTIIELHKEDMKFSAGHFTIFSATERERLHGHNFRVRANFDCLVGANGLTFDYAIYKLTLAKMCQEWNEYFLLPSKSAHLQFERDDSYLYALFGSERIPFLEGDVLLLPISNVTIEELSWLMAQTLVDRLRPEDRALIVAVTVAVFSGPGQSASTSLPVGGES